MATTTYIFADQIVASGTLSFKVKTSFGAGGDVDVYDIYEEKYFSDEISIDKETDNDGGDIASESATFTIDNDVLNLFEKIIFAGLTDVNAWVSVEVRLNGLLIFGGIVRKSTIRYSSYYSYANISGETTHKKITFSCVWYLDLLRNVTAKNFGLYLASDNNYSTLLPHIYAEGVGTGSDFRVSNICQIISACFKKLNDEFGFTYKLSFDNIKYTFFSRRGGGSDYKFPSDAPSTNRFYDDVGFSLLNAPSVCIQTGDGFLNGIFDERNDEYADNAYEIFVSALKSFGLFVGFRANDVYDIDAFISTRSSGVYAEVSEILEQSDEIYTTLARDSVSIRSAVSGNEYQKDFNSSGESTYSASNLFDFGNNNDFGGNLGDRSKFSLLSPLKLSPISDTMLLVRAMGVGDNLLVNPNFNGMDGWTTTDFTSHTSEAFPDGCCVSGFGTSIISQTFTADENNADNFIVSLEILSSETYTLLFDWYRDENGSDILWSSESISIGSGSLATNPRLAWFKVDGISPSKIVITAIPNSPSGQIIIGKAKMFISRNNTCEIMGKLIEKYFSNPNTICKRYSMNGIKTSYKLSDYVEYDNELYFINRIRYDLANNETEIEAINYPY